MEHIEKNGLDSVGLYRLSGNAASVQKLRCIVEQGGDESGKERTLSVCVCVCVCVCVHYVRVCVHYVCAGGGGEFGPLF